MFDTKWSCTSCSTPVATFRIISFRATFPSMSTWSAVVPPPLGIVGEGLCGSYSNQLAPARSERYADGRTSTVTTFIPAGFHRFRCHPSTHIAPRLRRLTVPSPSPIFTPFSTFGMTLWSVYSASIQLLRDSGMSSGVRGVRQFVLLSVSHTAGDASVWTSSYSYSPRLYQYERCDSVVRTLYYSEGGRAHLGFLAVAVDTVHLCCRRNRKSIAGSTQRRHMWP